VTFNVGSHFRQLIDQAVGLAPMLVAVFKKPLKKLVNAYTIGIYYLLLIAY
jgi:hypothetical protein